ncbi:hypothetical protein A0H81_13258 [Grifola frondosa]|uniref:AB hydrolase-1 domain-containing protein n=1 Tax=Grifola frondosa TaxID=5627 RepID=A0A1C7LQM7_GRIFR|nr:hypothetical protein A0H81_13258 [Grifola frondosa]
MHIFLTGLGTGVNVDFSRRNLVGIGHSMGATAVLLAGTYSPNLMFSSIILVDPMLLPPLTKWDSTGLSATLGGGAEKRRDIWASREEAMSIFKSKSPWKDWDPRVLRIYVEYGLRELPTAEYPDKTGVTLACHKTQEAACFRDQLGRVRSYNLLPVLCDTIPVHFIYGAIDDYLPSEVKADILNVAARGKYASDTRVKGVGHLVPQVQPAGLADAIWTALNHRSAHHETAQSHL